MSRSARTSGRRCRRRPTRRWPARAAGQSLRQQHHHRQGRGAAPAVRQPVARVPSRPTSTRRPGRRNRRPTSPGTATPRSTRWATRSPRRRASRRSPTIVTADIDVGRIAPGARAQRRASATARTIEGDKVRRFRRSPSRSRRPSGTLPLARQIDRFPTCRRDPAKLARGLLRGLQHPGPGPGAAPRATGTEKAVIGVSGGLDSTQALIVAAGAFDRSGCRARTSSASPCRASPPPTDAQANAWR